MPDDVARPDRRDVIHAILFCFCFAGLVALSNRSPVDFLKWSVGLFGISLCAGYYGSAWWYKQLTRISSVDSLVNEEADRGVLYLTGPVTGVVERLFFSIAIGLDLNGMGAAIITWNAIKLTAHYNIFAGANTEGRDFRRLYRALLSSLGSLLFAIVGGWFCAHGFSGWIK